MSDRRLAAVILVATGALAGAAVPSTAHAGGGGAFLPPMRVDVGPSVSSIEDAPAGQVVAGIHWASVYPKGKAGFDVGIGIVSTFRGTDDDATATARVTDPMAEADDPLGVFGGYVEVAARTAGNGWWRNWVGMRVESGRAGWDHRSRPYVGLVARVSTEAYLSGAAGGHDGIILGVVAIGAYAEVAGRRIDDLGDDVAASVGLSFRIPLVAVGH